MTGDTVLGLVQRYTSLKAPPKRQVSLRLPADVVARVDALAQASGLPRGVVVEALLRAVLEAGVAGDD